MLLLLAISVSCLPFQLPVFSMAVPPSNAIRNSRHLGFKADEMLQNAFDEAGSVFPDFGKAEEKFSPFNETAKASAKGRNANQTKSNEFSIESRKNATADRDSMTERNVILFGGAHYNFRGPGDSPIVDRNNTGIKIFWTSLGEAVESIPFLPIQINVPDMISAMASFLVTHVPFINRFTNQNDPRDPFKLASTGGKQTEKLNYYQTETFVGESDEEANRRQYRIEPEEEEAVNVSKKRRKTKRKSNKKRNSSQNTRRVFQLPSIRRTTPSPNPNTNFWHSLGSNRKELVRVKNMPIVRKRNRLADREIFNFKNSDISNSPIMILNVPHRPITQFKIIHEESKNRKMQQKQKQRQRQQLNQQQQLDQTKYNVTIHGEFTNKNSTSKPRRKLQIGNKIRRPSKRSGERNGERSKSTGIETTTLTLTST